MYSCHPRPFMKPISTCLKIALVSLLSLALCSADEADKKALLEGVNEIRVEGTVGALTVTGPDAFPVMSGKEKGGALPIVAASRLEKGRFVAFGHEKFFSSLQRKDTGKLILNSVRWAAGDKKEPRVTLMGFQKDHPLLAYLKEHGFNASEVLMGGAMNLRNQDVIIINSLSIVDALVPPLESWVRAGGGCLVGLPGWGWLQSRSGDDLGLFQKECLPSKLTRQSGIVFSTAMPGYTSPGCYLAGEINPLLNASTALTALLDHTSGKTPLPQDDIRLCGTVLSDALRSLPPDDKTLRPLLDQLPASAAHAMAPGTPVHESMVLNRLLFTRDFEAARSAKPEEVKAHPYSAVFPGATPRDAPRIGERRLSFDLSVPRWHGTGLYAPAGEVIRITVPPQFAGKGIAVRIGCHTDVLWNHELWKRAPEISIRRVLKEPATTIASPFGGLIYIDVPDGPPPVKMDVTISGAVQSPRFVLGQSTTADWKKHLAESPAPWGEIETKKLILSMPRKWLENIEDPQALLEFWDQVMDAEADLCAIPRKRKSPERIVADEQISAGYMHSGYPIMTWLDPGAEAASSVEKMRNGNWGYFHELGHNHQSPDWTFDGTVEVTCNLFSLYVTETLCGNPPGRGHEAMAPAAVTERIAKHLASPDTEKFTRWKKDPFVALIMYDQLRAAFGWDTYKKVFAEYRALPKDQRPKNDDEKRDQWLVRFSKAAGKNLGPFFEKWGVPTSEAARQSISGLPG
ncbi:MAG: hypothetical protein EOP88_21765, partial [Verrucomicrobiaceae bacterium]